MGTVVSTNLTAWAVAQEQIEGAESFKIPRYPCLTVFNLLLYYFYFICHLHRPSSGRIMKGDRNIASNSIV